MLCWVGDGDRLWEDVVSRETSCDAIPESRWFVELPLGEEIDDDEEELEIALTSFITDPTDRSAAIVVVL